MRCVIRGSESHSIGRWLGLAFIDIGEFFSVSRTYQQMLGIDRFVKLGNHLNCAKVYFLSYISLTEEKSYLSFDGG